MRTDEPAVLEESTEQQPAVSGTRPEQERSAPQKDFEDSGQDEPDLSLAPESPAAPADSEELREPTPPQEIPEPTAQPPPGQDRPPQPLPPPRGPERALHRPDFRPAPPQSIQQALEETNEIIQTLRATLEDMEEVLETLELAERQKDADEQEIESLRRALRQLHRPRDGGGHRH